MKEHFNKINNVFFFIILFFFSLTINFYYGYRGIFPQDSFFHFDAAYNILNNLHPFKDFYSISGVFVDYLQAAFFYFFGVSWFSYILHAATINCLLSIFSFILFNTLGLSRIYSFLYSIGISIIAYTSAGSPFVDYHGVIFSLLSIYSLIFFIIKKNNVSLFFLPVFLFLSFLSKQIPAAYVIIYLGLILLFYFIKNFQLKKIASLFFGCLACLIFFVSYLIIFKINFSDFLIQYFLFPLSIGKARSDILNINFLEIVINFKFIFFLIFALIFLNIKIFLKKEKKYNEIFFIINCIIGTALIFVYSQLLTKNQILIFFLIPVLMAFFHCYYFLIFKKKYFLIIMICLTFFSVAKYHHRYNENKYFMDFNRFEIQYASEGEKIDKIFYRVKWLTPFKYYKKSHEEVSLLRQTKDYINLNTNKNNVIFITDYLFFSSITNHKIASPVKWYDDVIIPQKNNYYYNYYKMFFIDKILKNKITQIYTIGGYDSSYFLDFVRDKNCIKKQHINAILSVYDITSCNFI